MSLWLHLAINVLSTVLLGASNYCMQCLSSPTRGDVDKAHSKGVWLDIGVPSVRNLRRISGRRFALWCLLAVSSIPLHFLYNSAVFTTLAAQSYSIFIGPSDLMEGPLQRWNSNHPSPSEGFLDVSIFERLDNTECIKAYFNTYVADRNHVVIVSSAESVGKDIQSISYFMTGWSNYGTCGSITPFCWMCSERNSCDTNTLLSDTSQWTIDWTGIGFRVDYCLSSSVKERCKLQFSLTILIVVIVCNFIKTFCMLLMLGSQQSPPLVTLGDAIASFLEFPGWSARKHQLTNSRLWVRTLSLGRWLSCNIL